MSDDLKIQKAIKNYLLKNPDYFLNHPELINKLNFSAAGGELTDLTAYQLRSLQKENHQLKQQINTLIHNAQQSESMMKRLFNLLLKLSVAENDDFLTQFKNFVVANFPSDYCKILLDEDLGEFKEAAQLGVMSQSHRKHFEVFQNKSEPISGRLQKEKIQSIFGEVGDINSAVVIPIGEQAQFGLLAFASKDQEKFHPNSASDLLQMLANVLATYYSSTQERTEINH